MDEYHKLGCKLLRTEAQLERRRLTSKGPGLLEEYNLTCTTCKERNANKFHERTAGIMIAAFP